MPAPQSVRSDATAGSDIDRCIETFVRGFCFTRSFTHPYEVERVGRLWVMRDALTRRPNDVYRREEWVSHGVEPAEVDHTARANARGHFAVCAIAGREQDDRPLRDGFKAMGYRLGGTEPMMIHSLRRVARCDPPPAISIERVATVALAERLAKAARTRQILPEHLPAPDGASQARLRQYVALADGEPVGWVRSIVVRLDGAGRAGPATTTWCSNMFVKPAYRRRGIARALLSRMLRDDRTEGAGAAVLLASHTGAKLYHALGYQQAGTLLAFHPSRGTRRTAQGGRTCGASANVAGRK